MQSGKKGKPLPPPQPARFGAAFVHSYMGGFWLGLFMSVSWLLQADLNEGGPGYFLVALGIQSAGWAKFWALVLFLVSTTPVSRAAVEYHRFTGRYFIEDRVGFAKAGGQDIGWISGLIAVAVTITLFYTAVPPGLISWFRVPLIILLATVLGNILSGAFARRAFSVLFGAEPR